MDFPNQLSDGRPRRYRYAFLLATAFCLVAACGGGGGGGSGAAPASDDPPAATPPPEPDPDPDPGDGGDPGDGSQEPLRGIYAASRLASRATFGMPFEAIQAMEASGEEGWLNQQFATPITYHEPVVTELLEREAAGDFAELAGDNDNLQAVYARMAWWQTTLTAQDQLRQRIAFALSEIFVISDNLDILLISAYATSDYYDMLLENAFGNFRNLLLDVTLHPAMGVYLSHINNARSNPEANTFPDENYAREVMQLFSIGLFELNADGSEVLDESGQPVPTYDNDDIREFAKVFTGLSFGGLNNRFGSERADFRSPMRMFEAFHEPGAKQLLRGTVVPAGQTGMEDIEAAVDNLFNHPNTGPFIGRQLIQRLVTSNPSPDYVARVSAAFNGDNGTPRGDMQAVLRAIFLDPEARALPDREKVAGKLREPVLRVTAALRQLNVTSPDGFFANTGYFVQNQAQQHPLSAPSVFNFFLPRFQPIGPIAELGLVAPEFQITNSSSVVAVSNLILAAVVSDFVNDLREPPFFPASLQLDDYFALAEDVPALIDRLDTVFTYGTLSAASRGAIENAIGQIEDLALRTRFALYLLLISADYAVEI